MVFLLSVMKQKRNNFFDFHVVSFSYKKDQMMNLGAQKL